jgi:hypothetical protein
MKPRESESTDHFVAAAAVAIYFALVVLFLPSSEYTRALSSGLVIFSIIFFVAWRFGGRIQSGFSVMAVALVATAALWMPTFPAMGGGSDRAVPIGFVGVQAAVLLWAAFWWPGPRQESSHITFRYALRFGFLVAVGISGVAAIPVFLTFLTGDGSSWAVLLVFPAYFAGFLSAAVLFWALQRIDNLAVGRYLIGVLGGICVYGAMGPAVAIFDHKAFDLHENFIVALIAGGFVGPALALNSYEIPKARLAKRSRARVR